MATPTRHSSTIGSETLSGWRISGLQLHTQIIATSPDGTDDSALEQAAATIRAGRVVAFPSSSGYVLAADPLNLNAIAAVFRAKGRQLNRALPILVDSTTTVEDYSSQPLSPRFFALARRFWPGPLTVITKASRLLPLKVTGNCGRLAVRHDSHAIANRLIERLDMPIIATSANVSGQSTCRSGIEVFGTMDGRVDLILDAGEADGLGATTVDITTREWKLIKAGTVTADQIASCLNGVSPDPLDD